MKVTGNVKYIPAGVTQYVVDGNDGEINVDTSVSAITIILPNIINSGYTNTDKGFIINDISNNAGTNNITIAASNNTVNSQSSILISVNGGTAKCSVASMNEWFAITEPTSSTAYTASNGVVLVGADFQLASHLISQFTNDVGYLTSSATTDLDPVISQTNTVPGSPTLGDRYLAGTAPGSPWTANSIEEWDGAAWITTAPVLDDVVFITSTLSTLRYNGSAWVAYAGTAVLNQGNTTGSTLVIGTNTAQALAFKTNNVETARVVSGGSWGFGTPIPSAKVSIKGQGATSATMAFDVRNSSNTLMLAVRNDGNVGIGTNTPTEKLDVNGNIILTSASKHIKGGTGLIDFYTNTGVALTSDNGNYGTPYVWVENSLLVAYAGIFQDGLLGKRIMVVQGDSFLIPVASRDLLMFNDKAVFSHFNEIGLLSPLVGIGSLAFTPTASLQIKGVDATSSNYALKVDNSASIPIIHVRNNRDILYGDSVNATRNVFENGLNRLIFGTNSEHDTSNLYIKRNDTYLPSYFITVVNPSNLNYFSVKNDGKSAFGLQQNYAIPYDTVLQVLGGNTSSDRLFSVKNNITNSDLLLVRGDGLVSINSNGASEDTTGNTVNTTNATANVTAQTIAVPTDKVISIESTIVYRKTGGAGVGTTGDGTTIKLNSSVKNVGGTLTLDTVQNTYTGTTNAIVGVSATYTISGTNVLVSVTGVVNDNITWNVITKVNTAA